MTFISVIQGQYTYFTRTIITTASNKYTVPEYTVDNPAFDITPNELVTSRVLDSCVYDIEQVRAGTLRNKPK